MLLSYDEIVRNNGYEHPLQAKVKKELLEAGVICAEPDVTRSNNGYHSKVFIMVHRPTRRDSIKINRIARKYHLFTANTNGIYKYF